MYAMPTEDVEKDNLALAMQRIFVQLQTTPKAVSTKVLTKAFGWDRAEAFEQQDVQELNRVLCDKLEEKMKGTVGPNHTLTNNTSGAFFSKRRWAQRATCTPNFFLCCLASLGKL